MEIKARLSQEAIQIANRFQQRELDLKNKQLIIETELQQVKAQRDASREAAQRGLNFSPMLGSDFACPECWTTRGLRAVLVPQSSDTSDDLFKCRECKAEFSFPE